MFKEKFFNKFIAHVAATLVVAIAVSSQFHRQKRNLSESRVTESQHSPIAFS